jgi:hypothetical protein
LVDQAQKYLQIADKKSEADAHHANVETQIGSNSTCVEPVHLVDQTGARGSA